MRHWLNISALLLAAGALGLIVAKNLPREDRATLINVSYDPTRELYQRLNAAFVSDYSEQTGRHLQLSNRTGVRRVSRGR
jgi:sulfate transport system substrate-binding protein